MNSALAQDQAHTGKASGGNDGGDVGRVIEFVSRQALAWEHGDKLFIAHQLAPERLKEELFSLVSPTVAGDALVHLGPAVFEKRRVRLDRFGQWAVWAPIFADGELVDWAAFDMHRQDLRRTWSGIGHFAVGHEEAARDAHYHPNGRLQLHYSVRDWLRADCTGMLPIDWEKSALWLKAQKRELVISTSSPKLLHGALSQALTVPKMFERVPE